MSGFTSPFAKQLDRFLTYKQGLGYAYSSEMWLLKRLDHVATQVDVTDAILDETLVRQFVADGTRGSRSHRLTLVRQLARFLVVEEPRTFIPPRRFLGVRRQRPVIRVLSRSESSRFLRACDELTDNPKYPHRGLIHSTLLRLLLLTGLRRGEALALDVSDIDLDARVIFVQRGKFGKSRFVPIAQDLMERLREYDGEMRARIAGRCNADAFFPGPDGHSTAHPDSLYRSFRRTLNCAGIAHGGRGEGPRLHDLRHAFAVLRLLAWYEQGANLSVKLPLLATYLGHIGLATSQVYLHMTLDITAEVVSRYQACFGDLITAEMTP